MGHREVASHAEGTAICGRVRVSKSKFVLATVDCVFDCTLYVCCAVSCARVTVCSDILIESHRSHTTCKTLMMNL